jgi:hypothetical protein
LLRVADPRSGFENFCPTPDAGQVATLELPKNVELDMRTSILMYNPSLDVIWTVLLKTLRIMGLAICAAWD